MNGGDSHREADEQWRYDYPLRGTALFEALPESFTFDDLMQTADLLEIPSLEAVEHLRIMQREQLIEVQEDGFQKLGKAVSA